MANVSKTDLYCWCKVRARDLPSHPDLRTRFRIVHDCVEMGQLMAEELVSLIETNSRPNVVGNPNGKHCLPGTFFNTCAFASDLVAGTFGNEGRNIAEGPGYQNWDVTLSKKFPVREQMQFEFRADFFNIFNKMNGLWVARGSDAQIPPVVIELGAPQYGSLQAARDPRFIQFAMKFYF